MTAASLGLITRSEHPKAKIKESKETLLETLVSSFHRNPLVDPRLFVNFA